MLRSGKTLLVILKRLGDERHYALCVNSHDLGLFSLLRRFRLGFLAVAMPLFRLSAAQMEGAVGH
jgi:hypothetical protein